MLDPAFLADLPKCYWVQIMGKPNSPYGNVGKVP